jgi:hypothetical protein
MYGYRHSIIDAQNREIAARSGAISYSAMLDDNWDFDTTRGFGLIADEAVDWSDFAAPDELYAELDAMEEDFPF